MDGSPIALDGTLLNPLTDYRGLRMFVVGPQPLQHCHMLVFIEGFSDTMPSHKWLSPLTTKLRKNHFCWTVLLQLSSSNTVAAGTGMLDRDAEEIHAALKHLITAYACDKIYLAGHSTGSQCVITYLRNYACSSDKVCASLLLSPVSDRFAITTLPDAEQLYKEATELRDKGEATTLLKTKLFGSYISAQRFLSMGEKGGADDMFSHDLTDEQLEPYFKGIKSPIALFYAKQDEFIPDFNKVEEFAYRLKANTLKHVHVNLFFLDGDHDFTNDKGSQLIAKIDEYFSLLVSELV